MFIFPSSITPEFFGRHPRAGGCYPEEVRSVAVSYARSAEARSLQSEGFRSNYARIVAARNSSILALMLRMSVSASGKALRRLGSKTKSDRGIRAGWSRSTAR
jgi:hypothetical protein